MTPEVWTDSTTSVCAALGLLIVINRMNATKANPLTARFRAALGLLAALMLVRVAAWISGSALIGALTMILAGLVPLMAVILTEGLLRRHAPAALKWLVAGGTMAFAIVAVLPGLITPELHSAALMSFQLISLGAIGLTVVFRSRADLAAEENRALDRMLLSLLLILPLLIGDFRTPWLNLPLRTGAIAILGLAWLSLGLGHSSVSARGVILGFVGLLALVAVTSLVLARITGVDLRTTAQIGGVILCVLLLLAIARDAQALRAETRADSVLRHLAHGSLTDPQAFLAGLQGIVGVDEAVVLTPSDLGDFDQPRLARIFTEDPLRAAAANGNLSPDDSDQLKWLFTRFEASHALLIRVQPLTLLVLNRPAIGGAELAELELRAVQRMAALLSARP